MNRALIGVLAAGLMVTPVFSQSILEELLPEAGSEVLSDNGYSTPTPYDVVEVEPPMSDVATTANLRGLDRINGTTMDITLNVGETVKYQRLEITLHACRYPQGDINEDAFAQMTIKDIREETARFSGWMFASSPALSALEHPRYDVWVLSCQNS